MNNMNHELAQELKEAGFPQNGRGYMLNEFGSVDEFMPAIPVPSLAPNFYVPTLEELIEACGEDFDLLCHDDRGVIDHERKGIYRHRETWSASSWSRKAAAADTPTEAVARLWLALNKKSE